MNKKIAAHQAQTTNFLSSPRSPWQGQTKKFLSSPGIQSWTLGASNQRPPPLCNVQVLSSTFVKSFHFFFSPPSWLTCSSQLETSGRKWEKSCKGDLSQTAIPSSIFVWPQILMSINSVVMSVAASYRTLKRGAVTFRHTIFIYLSLLCQVRLFLYFLELNLQNWFPGSCQNSQLFDALPLWKKLLPSCKYKS